MDNVEHRKSTGEQFPAWEYFKEWGCEAPWGYRRCMVMYNLSLQLRKSSVYSTKPRCEQPITHTRGFDHELSGQFNYSCDLPFFHVRRNRFYCGHTPSIQASSPTPISSCHSRIQSEDYSPDGLSWQAGCPSFPQCLVDSRSLQDPFGCHKDVNRRPQYRRQYSP